MGITVSKEKLYYLASPYNHPVPAIMEHRRVLVCRKAAELIEAGHVIFCPIAHNVAIAEATELQLGWNYWKHQDEGALRACDILLVYCLAGWEDSQGVAAEIKLALELGIEIQYIQP